MADGQALDEAAEIIRRRLNEFDVEGEVTHEGDSTIVIELNDSATDEAQDAIGRTALLQFCQPVIDEATGRIAIARTGAVRYEELTCQPTYNDRDNIVVDGGEAEFVEWPPLPPDDYTTENIVWEPAAAQVDGEEMVLDGRLLRRTVVVDNPDPVQASIDPQLFFFELNDVGTDAFEAVTTRLAEQSYPLAIFLDGEPIRGQDGSILAPLVNSVISGGTAEITGLSENDERDLSRLLNVGAFPIPMEVVSIETLE